MEITNATTTFEGTGLSEFFKAMAAAQAEMKPVYKDAKNDAFKGSKYATLAAVCEVVIPIMSKHGLAVLQAPGSANGEVTVETIIGHASGTMMRTSLALKPTKADPQGVGSAITYGRRYALLSLAGVAPEDDDGNAASASTAPARTSSAQLKRSGAWDTARSTLAAATSPAQLAKAWAATDTDGWPVPWFGAAFDLLAEKLVDMLQADPGDPTAWARDNSDALSEFPDQVKDVVRAEISRLRNAQAEREAA